MQMTTTTSTRPAESDQDISRPQKRARKEAPDDELDDGECNSTRHPLGVLPSGNLLLSSESPKDVRTPGLGSFSRLADGLLLSVFSTLDARSLNALGCTSRALYAFTSHEALWKNLFISTSKGILSQWNGSWRRTYLQLFSNPEFNPESQPVLTPGVYSDELFQPILCAGTSLVPYFYPRHGRARCNMQSHSADRLASESFSRLYAKPNHPVIIANALSGWKSFKDSSWTMDSLLSRFQDVLFRAEAFDIPFSTYYVYSRNCANEDSPLYLFDSRFVQKTGGAMGSEYFPFDFFGRDLFDLLGPERPDFRWLIAGPARSGSTFHKDPNGTSAWNAVLTGRKGWVMFPPDVCPPGVYTNEDESEVTSPLSISEWFLTYFDFAWRTYGLLAKDPKLRGKMTVGVCGPGEVVYVPSGWWHLVVNLEESVAVTQNFVSENELPNVLQFMRDKPDQMSGFKGGLSPEEVYKKFLSVLETEEPDLYKQVTETINLSNGKPKASMWDRLTTTEAAEPANHTAFSFGFEVDEDNDSEEVTA